MRPSSAKCLMCTRVVRPAQHALQCDGCERWQHRICGTDHIHAPDNLIVKRVKIAKEVKDAALTAIHRSAGSIAEAIMTEHLDDRDFNLPRPDYLARSANRLRQHLRPQDPKDLDFEIDHGFLQCEDFIIGDERVDNQRHILFATQQQLNLLKQAKRWYLDGTFKVRKDPFKQLYSVHAFLQKEDSCKQVPLAFILMSSCRTQDYEAIESAYRNLSSRATTPELRDLVGYIESQWIQNRIWHPVNWCVYRQPVRTNNDVEGWHHRLNGKAGRANLPFYTLVPLLLKEGSLVTIQMRLVSENALSRHQRTAFRRVQGKISKLWDQYDDDNITTSTFLKQVGNVYAPRPCTD